MLGEVLGMVLQAVLKMLQILEMEELGELLRGVVREMLRTIPQQMVLKILQMAVHQTLHQ